MLGKVEGIAHSRFAGGRYLPAGERGGDFMVYTCKAWWKKVLQRVIPNASGVFFLYSVK